MYPMLLQPSLHVKVWGGRKLETVMGKTLPSADPYGESWEMHDSATVANGIYAGQSLRQVLDSAGADLIGAHNPVSEGVPLLAKILTAEDWLSVQVHPNDEQAHQLEGQPRGKTEAWYVLAAEPGAKLVKAVQPGTTRESMAQAIRDNRMEDILVYAEVEAGDVLYVVANTVHALGPGIVIYEIQQSSDTTYRLYDWGRMDLDGTPRALHIDKGVQVSNVDSVPDIRHTQNNPMPVVEVVSGPYFTTLLHQLSPRTGTRIYLDTGRSRFHILTCIDGEGKACAGDLEVPFTKGQTVFIPAALGVYSLCGEARVLRSFQT